ncbi:MAG: hypothetical protein KAH14_02105 [Clostridiales bacterium]|nr:hypothetical protein [Clostridiales bacterium]
MPYEDLIYNETLMMEVLLVALFLCFVVVAVMLFISIRDGKIHHPLLRPVADPAKIAEAIEAIIHTRSFYDSNTSYLLESRKAISEMLQRNKVGLLFLQNVGNSSAVDIELKTFGDYFISDGPETKMLSINQGEYHSYLLYLPEDMINNLILYNVKLKYHNIKGKTFTSHFHIALSPEPRVKIDDTTELRVYVQI